MFLHSSKHLESEIKYNCNCIPSYFILCSNILVELCLFGYFGLEFGLNWSQFFGQVRSKRTWTVSITFVVQYWQQFGKQMIDDEYYANSPSGLVIYENC